MFDDQYLKAVSDEVQALSRTPGTELPEEQAFADWAMSRLVESAELSAPTPGWISRSTLEVAGVDWDDERGILSVIVGAYFTGDAKVLTRDIFLRKLDRLVTFVEAALGQLPEQLLHSDPAKDVALTIREVFADCSQVRLLVVTNGSFDDPVPLIDEVRSIPAKAFVWDIRKFRELEERVGHANPINVDLDEFGGPLDAIGPFGAQGDYDAYLLVFPGDALADIYAEYGHRLLELNVRSFLQARNRVNKGIQDTIAGEPHRFFAYNNGLTMTASKVTRGMSNGRMVISNIEGLQIVNGGQTTASLHHAKFRKGADLSAVEIPAKLTVLLDEAREDLAPKVSRFANSQNPVRMADFSANDPFHIALEALSRSETPTGAQSRESHWFYERSRGQYLDMLAEARTSADASMLRTLYPPSQKFVKTDIAKYELSWDQRPQTVSLGGEKHFAVFMQLLKERPSEARADATYFHELIAKAILFKATDKIVSSLQLGGYKAQAVTYTVALLSNRTAQRVDMEAIWKAQAPPAAWEDAVRELAPLVHEKLINSAGLRNVTEWAKKEQCWEAVQSIEWSAPAALIARRERTPSRVSTAPKQLAVSLPASEEELTARQQVMDFGATRWFELSAWAKDTNNLAPWQRSIAFSLGRLSSQSRTPSEKQAIQGCRILEEAKRLGFVAHDG